MHYCMILRVSVIISLRYFLESFNSRYEVSVYLFVLLVCIFYVCIHCYVAANSLLLCGVATTSTVPASHVMGDQPLYS